MIPPNARYNINKTNQNNKSICILYVTYYISLQYIQSDLQYLSYHLHTKAW